MDQPVLFMDTDTSTPRTQVPIFYMHEGAHPFCLNAACICHAHEAQLKAMLQGVLDGDLKLRKAYNGVIVGRGIE